MRWSGPYASAYKLPTELDQLLNAIDTESVDLRMLAAPDADVATLEHDLAGLGAVILSRSDTLNGPTLRLQLLTAALRIALTRDDVLWVERYLGPSLLDDRANGIMGVDSGRQQLGLDGRGQIVAIADTGLDVQADVRQTPTRFSPRTDRARLHAARNERRM